MVQQLLMPYTVNLFYSSQQNIEIMKTFKQILGIVSIGITLSSCSSVKVADSWKTVQTNKIEDKKMVVLSKTDNPVVRKQFETVLTQQLQNQGYNAIESFTLMPELKHTNNKEAQPLKENLELLKENNITIAVVTVLREVKDYKKVTTSSSGYQMYTYPVYARRGFYRSFRTVYVTPAPATETTTQHKKYVLETLTYDLSQPENEQLISVITTEIENPTQLKTVSKDFAKTVVKEMAK